MSIERKIAVVGLGYVGLPVAVAFGQKKHTIGYDKSTTRIQALKRHHDHTHEVSSEELQATDVLFTNKAQDLREADFYIIAVPTPIDHAKRPDLSILLSATQTVAEHLKPGDIVVYESTVYPGATEEDCIPVLEQYSGLTWKQDFHVGYSPERINPGDKEHTFKKITKVVSGDDAETLAIVARTYASVVDAGVHEASSIKVAEAAKVIENTQRDINIALMNELALIFNRMNIDTQEVLAAAGSKWNFLNFKPGLVGGHCIGVDPYYLTHKAQQMNYHPEVILSGRRINDHMGAFIGEKTVLKMIQAGAKIKGSQVAILGLTFKENCNDIRNTRVIDIIKTLQKYDIQTKIHAPYANAEEAKMKYDLSLSSWDDIENADAVIVAVAHQEFQNISVKDFQNKLSDVGIVIDIKNCLTPEHYQQLNIWRL